ncbi:unnamed protein product, partial [Ranitomeya imitator]
MAPPQKKLKKKIFGRRAYLTTSQPLQSGIGCIGPDKGQARKCLDAVEIYNVDGNFWREGPAMPYPLLTLRSHASSTGAVDGKLYVCGGYRGA